MKRKLFLVMALFAIITLSFCVWNWSFQLGRILHIDYHIIDVLAGGILSIGFFPSGLLAEKKEDEA